jgi:hypothetical protein
LIAETEVRLESNHGFSGSGFGASMAASNVEEVSVGKQAVGIAGDAHLQRLRRRLLPTE